MEPIRRHKSRREAVRDRDGLLPPGDVRGRRGAILKEERTLIDNDRGFPGARYPARQMEQHLRASEERYRCSPRNASDIIWVIDANLKITYISPSAPASSDTAWKSS